MLPWQSCLTHREFARFVLVDKGKSVPITLASPSYENRPAAHRRFAVQRYVLPLMYWAVQVPDELLACP